MRLYLRTLAVMLFPMAVHAGVVHDLAPGAVHEVTTGDAECFTNSFIDPDEGNLCPIRAYSNCLSDGEVDLSVTSCVTLRAAKGGSHGHYQYWFRVMPAGGDPPATPTFVPIHILASDLIWDLKLSNGALSEEAGTASATFFLRLRSDPVDDLASRGTTVSQTPVLLATHGGIRGCLSIPTGVDDVVNLVISCHADTDQIQQGKASPSIAAVVEVGRTYSVELAMDLNVTKRATIKPTSLYVGTRNDVSDPPGPLGNVMKWSKLVISIGTSTDDLQLQIDDLQDQLDALRDDFEGHSHQYLTGRGIGHNNVKATTGLPSFPDYGGVDGDADGDGVADASDLCPNSPRGEPTDLEGCTAGEFCVQFSDRRACRAADWQADEGRKPNDCRWNQSAATCSQR